ncbi:MAG: hypothetical protein ACKV2Q_27185 [Planctomycetaceae bacterium]
MGVTGGSADRAFHDNGVPWIAKHATSYFWSLCGFIGAVSAYDAWLVVLTKSEILLTERNPLCWHLIRLEPEYLSLFLPAKAAGTIAVLAILFWLYSRQRWHALSAASGVAAYQFGLLLYLHS